MANPRGNISFDGILAEFVTYKADGVTITFDPLVRDNSAAVGLACSLSAAGTVQLASDGEGIVGRVHLVEWDSKVTVQVEGYCALPGGLAASLTRGKKIVGALGAASAKGYIREVNTAVAAELGVARGQITDATDPTATWVSLL